MEETKIKFIKAYEKIMENDKLDLYEAYLMCLYINKYSLFGNVITSDSEDARHLKIDRHYVANKRKHLENLGFIKCETEQGKKKPTIIQINKGIIKQLKLNKDGEQINK